MWTFRFLIATAACLPLAAQNYSISGTLVTGDSGAPIPGAALIAFQKTTSASQPPTVYKAFIDSAGRYAMSVARGQYQLCVHNAGLYLDPCRWGGAPTVDVTSAAVPVPNLRLTRGGRFIVRAHDAKTLLAAAETQHGDALSVTIVDPSGKEFALPIIHEDWLIRDYGDIMPIGLAMTAKVSSGKLVLADPQGAAPNPQGTSFQVEDLANSPAMRNTNGFPQPNATIVHVQIIGRR